MRRHPTEQTTLADETLYADATRPIERATISLNASEIRLERVVTVAGVDSVDQHLRVSEQFSVVAVGRQISTALHDVDDCSDSVLGLVGHAPVSGRRRGFAVWRLLDDFE
jgi:hypothetical protein